MKTLFLSVCLLFSLESFGQLSIVSGLVRDTESREPIEGANVFLGSTSLGASTGKSGKFTIADVALGHYDLLISIVGYETLTTRIEVGTKNPSYTIELKKQVTELDEVSIMADTAGWYNNYLGFVESFLGRTRFSRGSRILNPRELTFYFEPKDGFYAHAKKPLVIENKALGYTITYHLQTFERNYESGVQFALGIPLFRDTRPGKEQSRKIRKARLEAYNGSLMHFLRSLKQKQLEAEGFTVFEVFKIKNKNRPPQELIDRKIEKFRVTGGDSLFYYSHLNGLPKEVDSLGYRFRTGEELISVEGNPATTKFTGMLRVIYMKELEDPAFIMFGDRSPGPQQSTLYFLQGGIKIYDNGYHEKTEDLLLDGYLGWAEKLGDMLPLDYEVPREDK